MSKVSEGFNVEKSSIKIFGLLQCFKFEFPWLTSSINFDSFLFLRTPLSSQVIMIFFLIQDAKETFFSKRSFHILQNLSHAELFIVMMITLVWIGGTNLNVNCSAKYFWRCKARSASFRIISIPLLCSTNKIFQKNLFLKIGRSLNLKAQFKAFI